MLIFFPPPLLRITWPPSPNKLAMKSFKASASSEPITIASFTVGRCQLYTGR